MKREEDIRVWMFFGALGAVALGIALIPLRGFTSASNLAFAFLIFTIILAELGGRIPGLVTAILSAISLNFFLTQPYMTLRIDKRDDLIAFLALLVCCLVAAAFGKSRKRYADIAGRVVVELAILDKLVDQMRDGISLDKVLKDLKASFGLGMIALRDAKGNLVAVAPPGATPDIPKTKLNLESLFPSQATLHRIGAKGFRLPEGGGRLSLPTNQGEVSLDLWEGNPEGLSNDESRTLAIAVSLLLLELSRRQAA